VRGRDARASAGETPAVLQRAKAYARRFDRVAA